MAVDIGNSAADGSDTWSGACATPPTVSPSPSPLDSVVDQLPSCPQQRLLIEESEEEDPPYDHMLEARQLVFWWQKSVPADDSEFCQNNAECKVKVSITKILY